MPGRFIALEGGDGCGKSTQARLLAEAIGARLTREPGGTPAGERMREIVLDPATGELDLRSEVLLYAASRAEHVAKVIRPALDAGEDVVCDRFIASSLAYQGHGRQLVVDEVAWINDWGTEGLRPDLTILVEVPNEVAAERLGSELDRLEAVSDDFRDRVAEGYRKLAAEEGWAVVDGTGTVDEVFARVRAAYEEHLP
ncbi:MAG TPA: dTMP kinase [Acidimicrobiales bacterium]|nr:dTMP kinase [Acidimicrobiales bacterium]